MEQDVNKPADVTGGILGSLDLEIEPIKDMDNEPLDQLFDDRYYKCKKDGKLLPPVLESILLRYLPAPFIKFLFERG